MRRSIIFIILLAVLAGGMWSWMSYRPQKEAVSPPPEALPTLPSAIDVTQEAQDNVQEAEPPKPLTDPFELKINVKKKEIEAPQEPGKTEEPVKEPALRLQGVWIDQGMKIAFINDQSLQIGDTIAGWRLAAIYQTKVTLVRGGQTKTLKVEE